MSDLDPRLGIYADDGSIAVRPTKTLDNKAAHPPYAQMIRLSEQYFAVLGPFPAQGYDIEAAVKRLKRKLETGTESDDEVTTPDWLAAPAESVSGQSFGLSPDEMEQPMTRRSRRYEVNEGVTTDADSSNVENVSE